MSHRFHLSMHDDYDSQELSVHTDFIESDIFLIVERFERVDTGYKIIVK